MLSTPATRREPISGESTDLERAGAIVLPEKTTCFNPKVAVGLVGVAS
jgi:hypothetical protein